MHIFLHHALDICHAKEIKILKLVANVGVSMDCCG